MCAVPRFVAALAHSRAASRAGARRGYDDLRGYSTVLLITAIRNLAVPASAESHSTGDPPAASRHPPWPESVNL